MTTFQSNIINIYGKQGKAWLDVLPKFIEQISRRLGLRALRSVSNLSHHYVLSGFQGDLPIILKLGLDSKALERETFALKCFAGYGAVTVLAADKGLLLLERAIPGTSLKSYFSDKATDAIKIVCHIMKKLHQAKVPGHRNVPHIKDWLSALDKDWDLPAGYLQTARILRDQLLQTAVDVLLHGDLHHDNILKKGDDWIIIDPKGVIGAPINEIWAFVMDMERDIPFIAQYFSFEVQYVFSWYFVHVVLAACWNLEANIDPRLFLNLAEKSYKYVS